MHLTYLPFRTRPNAFRTGRIGTTDRSLGCSGLSGTRRALAAVLAGSIVAGLLGTGATAQEADSEPAPAPAEQAASAQTPPLAVGANGQSSGLERTAPSVAFAQSGQPQIDQPSDEPATEDLRLRLNFNGTPWREVLEWFTEETGMSLQRSTWPTGTFSYSDPRRTYDVSQTIDAMNLVLMREGYALIRRGQLMLLVDLEDDFARDYLRELAEPVRPEELDDRANSDYVRVAFPLGGLDASSVVEDLEKLRGPSGSVQVLAAPRVIVATDTVGVLKSIRDVLLATDAVDGGVMEYEVQHRAAEDLLELARPHLGLEPGENTGEEINVSTNLIGDRIYATGDPIKLRVLRGLIEKSDRPLPTADEAASGTLEVPFLETYDSGSADSTVALEVLQRMLAGLPDVRLTLDPKTQSIIAQGRRSDHQLIASTLAELNGSSTQSFKVIQLRRIDPQAALLTINKYFGKTAENTMGPTVDGDPVTKKLWVKGTENEVEEVERLIQELEGGSGSDLLGDRIRILPYTGRSAQETISQLESLWQMSGRANRIRMMSTQELGGSRSIPERRLNGPSASIPTDRVRRSPFDEELRGTEPIRRVGPSRREPDRQPAGRSPSGNEPSDQDQGTSGDPESNGDQGTSGDQGTRDDRGTGGDPEAGDDQPAPREASLPGDLLGSNLPYQFVNSPAQSRLPQSSGDGEAAKPNDGQPDGVQPDGGQTGGAEEGAPTTGSDDPSDRGDPSPRPAPAGPPDDIVIRMTPQGIIVASEDTEALNDFEALMATLTDQMATGEEPPTVYWLKYIKASVASDLLNSVLSGSSGGDGGDLTGGLLGEIGGGMLGGLMGLGGGGGGGDSGPVFTTTGTVSIVPDSRLNALIIQANSTDLRLVEDILQVIDREESPENVRTSPKPQLIPVIYQNANDVATIVKGVYSDRIAGQTGGQNRQPSPEDFINALRGRRGGGGGGGGQGEENKPTPISIAVDARSNSLIVAAPPQDFVDIRELVEVIDQEGMDSEESVQVVTLGGNVNAQVVQNALSAILGPQASANSSTTSSPSSNSGSPSTESDNNAGATASDIQQRIEFFRRMREMGGGGRGGGRAGGGGSPFGGGGGRGGGGRGGR